MSGIANSSFIEEKNDQFSSQSTFEIADVNDNTEEFDRRTKPSGLEQSFEKLKIFRNRNKIFISKTLILFLNVVVVGYFAWATYYFIDSKNRFEALSTNQGSNNETNTVQTCGIQYCGIQWCDGYGMLIILLAFIYLGLFYYLVKRLWGNEIQKSYLQPLHKRVCRIFAFRTDSSILDAASNGAITAISLVLGIIANIVAFVAFVAFLNGAVNWLGILIGYDFLTFEWLFAKLFIPLAWIMGIEWDDCENVGQLIAIKIIVNEFVAYERLGKMKAAQEISLRSSAIATFAVCGFANPSSLGIMIGALSAMCPEKRPIITSVAIRAFISGSVVCFLTASIAGLLITSDNFESKIQNITTY